MFNNAGPSLADIAAVTNNNEGFGDSNGWWVLIILFAICGGWNNGNGGFGGRNSGGVTDGYVLASDFANVQRQIENVNNGICSLGYDQLSQMNGINTNIMQNANALSTQLANCCCENREAIAQLRYDLATDTCALKTSINDMGQAIMLNDNQNYRQLHDEIVQIKMEAKDNTIAQQAAMINALQQAASTADLKQYINMTINKVPEPSYIVPNPYTGRVNGYNGCGTSC